VVAAVHAVLVDLGGMPVGATPFVTVLAQATPPPGKGAEFGKASPVGLVVVLLLAIATVFLIRSMSKRIKRLPASFDPPPERADDAEPDRRAAGRDVEDAGGGRA
jgi:hypothetical protein